MTSITVGCDSASGLEKVGAVGDYCNRKLERLFSQDREATWESLRNRCNDASLNSVDAGLYYANLRAAMLELMLIAITKSCSDIKVRGDTRVFVDDYLNGRGLTGIASLNGRIQPSIW